MPESTPRSLPLVSRLFLHRTFCAQWSFIHLLQRRYLHAGIWTKGLTYNISSSLILIAPWGNYYYTHILSLPSPRNWQETICALVWREAGDDEFEAKPRSCLSLKPSHRMCWGANPLSGQILALCISPISCAGLAAVGPEGSGGGEKNCHFFPRTRRRNCKLLSTSLNRLEDLLWDLGNS